MPDYNGRQPYKPLMRTLRVATVLLVFLSVPTLARASDAMFLRLFLIDGTSVVSYGEYARLDDRVVFSMPVGGTAEQPRLHLVSLPVAAFDWGRTDSYTLSARYQQYASTRGEEDFLRLSNDVARALSQIAQTTEPAKALQVATSARARLADWPTSRYGYRQRDINEIVGLLDESIANLRVMAGVSAFELALVASPPPVSLQPVRGMPGGHEMFQAIMATVPMMERSTDRILLLQSALALLDGSDSVLPTAQMTAVMRSLIGRRISDEVTTDELYSSLSRRLLATAEVAAAAARVRDVEAVLATLPKEDRRLGLKRPEMVVAIQASLHVHLDDARRLRLLRDHWLVRRDFYRGYQRTVARQLLRLVKAQPTLEAIKKLAGPEPQTLSAVARRLAGDANRLAGLTPPQDLRGVHDLLIGAARFAEQAIQGRRTAVSTASVDGAWAASSAAAASMMLLTNFQEQLRSFAEPPRLR